MGTGRTEVGRGFKSLVTPFYDHFLGLDTVGMGFIGMGGRTWQGISVLAGYRTPGAWHYG